MCGSINYFFGCFFLVLNEWYYDFFWRKDVLYDDWGEDFCLVNYRMMLVLYGISFEELISMFGIIYDGTYVFLCSYWINIIIF